MNFTFKQGQEDARKKPLGKVFVGPKVSDLDIGGEAKKISRVILNVDSENSYIAGDDTGRTIEKTVPWANQAMANNVLNSLRNVSYRPFDGTDGLLDLRAEIGDGITVDALYSVLAYTNLNFDKMCTAGISAPAGSEIEDEYPYKSRAQRQAERQLAQTNSRITKTAEAITLRIEGNEESIQATLDLIDGFTVTDSSGTTKIKGSSIETDSISARSISADKINLTGAITFNDLSTSLYNQVGNSITAPQAQTLINSTLVSSPNIVGASYWNYNQTARLVVEDRYGGYGAHFIATEIGATPIWSLYGRKRGGSGLEAYITALGYTVMYAVFDNINIYKTRRTIKPKGVMVHSTGANNPTLRRYVQPVASTPERAELLAQLGTNKNGNHWNRSGTNACVHGFIGKLADGSVAAVQTLPWNHRGWHAGTGTSGRSANDTHISFEICEDGLTDPAYFAQVYREAVELTAMLCREYSLDPLADGVVICHQDGYKRGIASNHGDVYNWFPKHGKSMDDFRADVAREMKGEDDEMLTYEQWKAYMEQYRKELAANNDKCWAEEELAAAVAVGITDGKRPHDLVTREEAAIMAARSQAGKPD